MKEKNYSELDQKKSQLKKFGLTMSAFFLILTLVSLYKHDFSFNLFSEITLSLAVVFSVCALVRPLLLFKVEHYWILLGEKMGLIITPIILALIFFCLILPIGIILRLFRKDLLSMKVDRSAISYWQKVEEDGPASRPYTPY